MEEWLGVGAYRVAQLPGVAPHDLNHFVSYYGRGDRVLERSIVNRIQTPFVRIASIRRNLPPFAENSSRNHARLDDRDTDSEDFYFRRKRLTQCFQRPF